MRQATLFFRCQFSFFCIQYGISPQFCFVSFTVRLLRQTVTILLVLYRVTTTLLSVFFFLESIAVGGLSICVQLSTVVFVFFPSLSATSLRFGIFLPVLFGLLYRLIFLEFFAIRLFQGASLLFLIGYFLGTTSLQKLFRVDFGHWELFGHVVKLVF